MKHQTLLFAGFLLFAASAVSAHEPKNEPKREPYRERVVPMRDYGSGYWDFRFGWGAEPMLTEAEYDYNDGTANDELDWEAPGGSLEFNVAHRFDGRSAASGFVTFGGFLRGFDGDDDPNTGDEVSLNSLGVQVGGGFSYRPNARYSLEIGPRIGFGTAVASERIGGDEVESDGGGYARLDVGAANLFNFNKVQFGVTVGIASWAATVPYDGQTVNGTFYAPADVTYSGAGGYLNLSIGFR